MKQQLPSLGGLASSHRLSPFARNLLGNAWQEVSDASYYAIVLAICLPVRIGS